MVSRIGFIAFGEPCDEYLDKSFPFYIDRILDVAPQKARHRSMNITLLNGITGTNKLLEARQDK
jgi:hypothetical protein